MFPVQPGRFPAQPRHPRNAENLTCALTTRIGGKAPRKNKGPDKEEKEGDHYQNSSAAIQAVWNLWKIVGPTDRTTAPTACEEAGSGQSFLRAARQSQRENPFQSKDWEAEVMSRKLPCHADGKKWVAENTKHLNAQQKEVVDLHVLRVFQEVAEEFGTGSKSRPFIHLVHGPPGTGKSTILRTLLKFFEDVVGWRMHREFTVGALQAVVAAALGGETLHHITGLNPFNSAASTDRNVAGQKAMEKLGVLRFLLIDEIFMLSAQFLAEVEQAFRRRVPDGSPFKRNHAGEAFSFGGVNITMFGDMYQLDPPDNAFPLYTVPSELLPEDTASKAKSRNPLVSQGLHLLWGRDEWSCNGLTELTQPYRCQDPWWNSVPDSVAEQC